MATDRIRTTISIDPQVHEIFKTMADAAGMSTSRMMGEWLADTAEAAQVIADKMVRARKAPMAVMREMQAYAQGINDEVDKSIEEIRQRSRVGVRSAPSVASDGSSKRKAPSSNTGLKSPKPPSKTAKKGK